MTVLVTGANGFVGAHVCRRLAESGHEVRGAVRAEMQDDLKIPSVNYQVVGELGCDTDWQDALHGVKAIVHLAARVHMMSDAAIDPLAEFRKVNTQATLNLARQAIANGCRRLVFISTIQVNGEQTYGQAFSESDRPSPANDYALSKWEAEQQLWALAAETELEITVLRIPLVYGQGVKGNLLRLLSLICKGWPLPLGAINNRRSLLGLENLFSAIAACLEQDQAAGRTYLVSDGEDVSTTELIRKISEGMSRRPVLLPVPVFILGLLFGLIGRRAEYHRLCGDLAVNSRAIRDELNWLPAMTVDEGLRQMGAWYEQQVG